MKRLMIGSLLAALAMFFWGFVFWGLSPIPWNYMKPVVDEDGLAKAMAPYLPETGVYLLPAPLETAGRTQETAAQKQGQGPLAQIVFIRAGVPLSDMGKIMALGYAHFFVCALLLGLLMRTAARAGAALVSFGTLAGSVGSLLSTLSNPVWFHHPWGYWLMTLGYDVVAWLLAAAVLARFVREPRG